MTWLPVPNYAGLYEVSDAGEVRSLDRGSRKGRTLKVGSNPKGYAIAVLCRDGVRKAFTVHGLVAAAFLGPRPEKHHVCHANGIKADNRVENLHYGTASQNELEKVAQGLNANSNKTHCPAGHEYSDENTYHQVGRNGRKCRTCHRDRRRGGSTPISIEGVLAEARARREARAAS